MQNFFSWLTYSTLHVYSYFMKFQIYTLSFLSYLTLDSLPLPIVPILNPITTSHDSCNNLSLFNTYLLNQQTTQTLDQSNKPNQTKQNTTTMFSSIVSKITSTAGARSLSQLAAPLSGMIGRNFLSIDELR